ncbi:hypothetical protein KM043_002802 [Ampulex compressa]|nr:hypothetical protein KM043_002802 [Ampulex compressa]
MILGWNGGAREGRPAAKTPIISIVIVPRRNAGHVLALVHITLFVVADPLPQYRPRWGRKCRKREPNDESKGVKASSRKRNNPYKLNRMRRR